MVKAKAVTLEQQLASRNNGLLKSQITTGKLRGKGGKKKGGKKKGGKKKGKENVREDHWEEEFDVADAPVAEPRVSRRARNKTSYKDVESDTSSSEEEEVTPRPSRGKRKVVSTGSRSRPSKGRR